MQTLEQLFTSHLSSPKASPHLEPLPLDDVKQALQQELARAHVDSKGPRAFDPESLEAFRKYWFDVLSLCPPESEPELRQEFLFCFPFLTHWEDWKLWMLTSFSGGVTHKERVLRTFYYKIKQMEFISYSLLHPNQVRNPLHSEITRWMRLYETNQLPQNTLHHAAVTPYYLMQQFQEHDRSVAETLTKGFLKKFYAKRRREKFQELQSLELSAVERTKQLHAYYQEEEANYQEHYESYRDIKQLELVQQHVQFQMDQLIEHLSRIFILGLPEEVFSVQKKLQVEQSSKKQHRHISTISNVQTYRSCLDQFMIQYATTPFLDPKVNYNYGLLADSVAGLAFHYWFNPYSELYQQLKGVCAKDWMVHQLAEHDRNAQNCERSLKKAQIYQRLSFSVQDSQGQDRKNFFLESLASPERCHVTATRQLELQMLEQLSWREFNMVFGEVREQLFQVPGEKALANPALTTFTPQEELLSISQQWLQVKGPHSYNTYYGSTLQQGCIFAERRHRQERQQHYQAYSEEPTNDVLLVEKTSLQVRPIVSKEPSFRHAKHNTIDLNATPQEEAHQFYQEQMFLRESINYYPLFEQVTQTLFEHYQDDVVTCHGMYAYFPNADKHPFEEKVLHLQVGDDYILGLGQSLLYTDPTNTQDTFCSYLKFYVRYKKYEHLPQTYQSRVQEFQDPETREPVLFQELSSLLLEQMEPALRSLLRKSFLVILRSLPKPQQKAYEVKRFLEYLQLNRPATPILDTKLREKVYDAGLGDRLSRQASVSQIDAPTKRRLRYIYRLLKLSRSAIILSRKGRLEQFKLSTSRKDEVLRKMWLQERHELYLIALSFDVYSQMRQIDESLNASDLLNLAGHFYGVYSEFLPSFTRQTLLAHLHSFDQLE